MSKVVNKLSAEAEHAKYVGRGSVWGNPFILNEDGAREIVIAKFKEYALWRLSREPDWLVPLKDKNLACYCAPLACHADILLQLANK